MIRDLIKLGYSLLKDVFVLEIVSRFITKLCFE